MPRKYKKKVGGRKYEVRDPQVIAASLRDIQKGMSISSASKKHRIPVSTLWDKVKGKHCKKVGGQTALTPEEEEIVAKAINELANWSYPVTKLDIRKIIKNYLDKKGKKIEIFNNNIPGNDFMEGFMRRNNLTQRLAANISKSRASVSKVEINEFFNNIKNKLRDVPAGNIFNFDETNLTDDPGSTKVVVSRGRKRVERVMEHYKSATSLMFCISATGEMLPPFVVFKAQNLYSNWCIGGPPGAQYGASKSGWFDSQTFESWFVTIFLPFVRDRDGLKILIGDNLASHFSPMVVDLCNKNNIMFTTIPPNSTHLMQPLDVAFFGPLKTYWRGILETWRRESRRTGTVPKEILPSLLSKLYQKLAEKGKENAKSGFRKTGLFPFNPEEVLKMIPGTSTAETPEGVIDILNESVVDFLKQQRGDSSSENRRTRGRKVTPGCAITIAGRSENILQQNNENFCGICRCYYETFRGPDWLQCIDCRKWICGFCNGRSKDKRFTCEACLDSD